MKTVSFFCRSFSGPYFSALGLNMERYGPNAGKYGPEKLRIRTLLVLAMILMKLMGVHCYEVHSDLHQSMVLLLYHYLLY